MKDSDSSYEEWITVKNIYKPYIIQKIKNLDTISHNDKVIILHNPYKNSGKFKYSGSLHNHTDNSARIDGYFSGNPKETVIKFRDKGKYDFYTFTDHNYITAMPEIEGILNLGNAYEDTKPSQHLGIHNIPSHLKSPHSSNDINTIIEYFDNIGAVITLNHPDWPSQAQPNYKLMRMPKVDFVEVLNPGDGGSERAFNILNGRFGGRVFGVGSDDYHHCLNWLDPDMFFKKAWVEVYCDTLSFEDVWFRLLSGSFYATKGDTRIDVSCKDGILTIESEYDSSFLFLGRSKNDNDLSQVEVLQKSNGNKATYEITGVEGYIYIKIQNEGGIAITQPINIDQISNAI